MTQSRSDAAILMADITGSTSLYEAVGDVAALRQIAVCLDRLRGLIQQHDGQFIHSKGDDVLCTFVSPSAALRAARGMLQQLQASPLGLHAGLHYGSIIHAREDIFGDAVNLTARLAALAKPGEFLLSRDFVDQLPEDEVHSLRLLDRITFKGKSAPTEVYSLLDADTSALTQVGFGSASQPMKAGNLQAVDEVSVTLHYANNSRSCEEHASLSIGRSPDCDIVIPSPWISRNHAKITIQRGKVELSDHSSSGTYVSMGDGEEHFMRRETLLLVGSGVISPALRCQDGQAQAIRYEIVRHLKRATP